MSRKAERDNRRGSLLGDVTRFKEQAAQLIQLSVWWERTTHTDAHIKSLSIYPPSTSRNGMWLIVLKGFGVYGGMVAFHRAPDLLTALLGALNRAAQGKLDWKRDEWADRDRR